MNTEQRTDTGLVLRIDSPVIDATMQNELTAERIEASIEYMEEMYRCCDTQTGNVPKAYATALAALRAEQERLNPQPLTWKDLAYMDGEPIWSEILEGDDVSAWEIFFADNYDESEYGVLWLAYLYGRPAKTQEGENDGTSNK